MQTFTATKLVSCKISTKFLRNNKRSNARKKKHIIEKHKREKENIISTETKIRNKESAQDVKTKR